LGAVVNSAADPVAATVENAKSKPTQHSIFLIQDNTLTPQSNNKVYNLISNVQI